MAQNIYYIPNYYVIIVLWQRVDVRSNYYTLGCVLLLLVEIPVLAGVLDGCCNGKSLGPVSVCFVREEIMIL